MSWILYSKDLTESISVMARTGLAWTRLKTLNSLVVFLTIKKKKIKTRRKVLFTCKSLYPSSQRCTASNHTRHQCVLQQINRNSSLLQAGLCFVQTGYGLTAALFEQGKIYILFGGRTMNFHNASSWWSDKNSCQCLISFWFFFINNLAQELLVFLMVTFYIHFTLA